MMKSFVRQALAIIMVAAAPLALAAAYPERPINMIVAFPPGGGTDLVARALAPFIEKYLGNKARFVVLNRPGAGGEIGFAAIANAAPDGYTIGFINTPSVLTVPIERKAQFSIDRYDLLANIVDDPDNFSVHTDSPVKSLKDLADLARSKPGQVTVGTNGIGTDDHLAMLLFERQAGVKMNHVPMRGAADLRTALMSRQVDVAAINIGEALQYVAGGSPMRQLGTMSLARTNLSPNLPTFAEQGYKIEMSSLRGMAAPKGLPAEIKQQLVAAIQKAVADPEFQAQAAKFYSPLRYLGPAEFDKVLRETEADFRALWKEMPWTDK
jgi:tripartite-type tricarboxylate transporter receptor subunit TctC